MTEQKKRFQLTHRGDGANQVLVDGIDLTQYVKTVSIESNWNSAHVTLTLVAKMSDVDIEDAIVKIQELTDVRSDVNVE